MSYDAYYYEKNNDFQKKSSVFSSEIDFCINIFLVSCVHVFWGFVSWKSFPEIILNICQTMSESNLVFVKILQACCCDLGYIDKDISCRLLEYTDNVPFTDADINNEVIEYVQTNTDLCFVHSMPVKSGLVSLIYILKDNYIESSKTYVLKMKRKNIRKRLNHSIHEMSYFLDICCWMFSTFLRIDLASIVHRHLGLLEEQLDFVNEATNIQTARLKFSPLDYVVIPGIYINPFSTNDDHVPSPYYSRLRKNFIIMDFIEGKSFKDLPQEEYDNYANSLIKFGMASLIMHGFVHADLHAGNILFIENKLDSGETEYKLGIIDFGITVKIEEDLMDVIMFTAMNYKNPEKTEEIVRMYLNNVIHPSNVLETLSEDKASSLVSDLKFFLDTYVANDLRIDHSTLFQSFEVLNRYLTNNLVRKYDIKMNEEIIKLEVALSMSHGVGMQLCKGNYNERMNTVIREMFHLDIFDIDVD